MEKIVYDYPSHDKVMDNAVMDALNHIYSISYPTPEKSFKEMVNELNEECEKVGGNENWRKTYCDGKYQWPIDFFYIPQEVLTDLWNAHKEANNVQCYWKEDMGALIEFLFETPGFKEVYEKDEYNEHPYRHCVDQKLIKDVIGEEAADKLRTVLEEYKNTYRWGINDVLRFSGAFLSTPTSKKETVVKAWKDAFDKDIEMPDDKKWVDVYENDWEEYEKECADDLETEIAHEK